MQNLFSHLKQLTKQAASALAFLGALGAILTMAEAQAAPVKVAPNRYIITRKPFSSAASAPATVSYTTSLSNGYFDLVTPKSAPLSAQSAAIQLEELDPIKVSAHCAEIMQDPSIASCEPDALVEAAVVPNDAQFSQQWGLHDPINNADIEVSDAWVRGTGSKSILVGVIDSGIYLEHPDLIPNVWSNPADPRDGVDNDGNGYVDDVLGVDTYLRNSNPQDCLGHGTHVAGIIGAKGDNGEGVAGVMWDVSIISAGIFHDCGRFAFESSIVAAYDYFYDLKVRGHDIRVINASFGGYQYSLASYLAISRLNQVGVLLVAAAGNNNKNMEVEPFYPAMYDLPNIISVAATGTQRTVTEYSNYGIFVDIAAPGGDSSGGAKAILSTYSPLARGSLLYTSTYGTSMAAPMVTGAIALISSQFPSLSAAELKDLLLQSGLLLTSLQGKVNEGRFLNVKRFSDFAARTGDGCPNDPNKTAPGLCGCGVADIDSDRDGVPDCRDSCPSDRGKASPGVCGCGVADTDGDGDGTPDCRDSCPSDRGKASPGVCGCGIADSDSDGDGVLDCQEACPSDRAKTSPGVCGCGISDSDSNGNGRVDCLDTALNSVIPQTPRIQLSGRAVLVSMAPRSGVSYYLQITVSPPRNSRRKAATSYYEVKTSRVLFRKPARGSRVNVRYAYFVPGSKSDVSYWSYFGSLTIRR